MTSSAAVSTAIPTGINSPVTYDSYDAWYVRSDGDVNGGGYANDVVSSYGRIIAGFIHILQLYVFLCNGRRKYDYVCSRIFLRNILISSHTGISSLCRIAGLKEFVFQLFYFHKGA